ncbi:hypothetical protein [Micromonospora echinofusca]|uniref:Uncharacterized protein n=1 Tax=Micromonospora echinofusca TaxID=47858 RepID=A0ABS3VZ70_MICEH|nr:hypothetical protein [Micromonospora echinofusca]MBO4209851.1 hypothetical protein [Micromonospora echinofusca]
MEYGGSTARRLLGVLVGGALVGAVLAIAGAVTVPALHDRSQQQLDDRARREVDRRAHLVRSDLLNTAAQASGATSTVPPARFRQAAERTGGVRVLRLEPDRDGLRLLFEVRVVKTGTTLFGYQQSRVVSCYQQTVPGGPAEAVRETPCPPAEP